MTAGMMIDNWTLQDLGTCLVDGLDEDPTSELVIDVLRDTRQSFIQGCKNLKDEKPQGQTPLKEAIIQ